VTPLPRKLLSHAALGARPSPPRNAEQTGDHKQAGAGLVDDARDAKAEAERLDGRTGVGPHLGPEKASTGGPFSQSRLMPGPLAARAALDA
jgi:hypothetical protein